MSLSRTWPARSSICLECRTMLPAATGCPHGAHRTVSLRSPGGREALLTTVWGSKSMRARLGEATRAGAIGGTGSTLLNSCSGCDALDLVDGHVAIVLAVAFFAFFLIWLVGRWVLERIRVRDRRLRARGARRAPHVRRSPGRIGTIVAGGAGDLLADPFGGRGCIAFGVTLMYGLGAQTMLRDGATLGFDVALDTGERIRIPAGICAIDAAATSRLVPRGSPQIDDYLRTLDPRHGQGSDLDPFPRDEVKLAVLRPGDRVEVLSSVVPIADPASAPAGYREAPPVVLVPDGAVRLRPAAPPRAP